jgi:hypothetical protein
LVRQYNRVLMVYLKALLTNILAVFFAHYLLPFIHTMDQTKLPHVGGDLFFAAGLGLLNSLVYLVLKALGRGVSAVKIAVVVLVLNFASYGIVRFLPLRIQIESIEGYLVPAFVVSVAAFLTNFFEMRRAQKMPLGPLT